MKNMIGRRGQGAMEYLMTYGWAILVVMIVGIVMWQLGIFNMGGTTVTATGFAKIKPQLAGTGLTTAGVFKSIFTNGVGTTIIVHNGGSTEPSITDGTTACTSFTVNPETVSAGQNFVLTASGCATGEPGEVYDLTVSIPYTVSIGTTSSFHRESGSIRGPMEQ
ncbi:MAG: hypothetical protein GF416_00380 [Candidatus Altiarchaeales archaeon]|nr:hypothetical protein [Candidatus Altiarchaeales archaeon]MBD3415576.1 hypothetical protein [Candidatus Altiarchaeales archaeon]